MSLLGQSQNEEGVVGAKNADDFLKSIPPGYRFCPLDEELNDLYLRNKVRKLPLPPNIIKEVNLMNYNPHYLIVHEIWGKRVVLLHPKGTKHPNGTRPNRVAGDGFWRATARDKDVTLQGMKIGSKRSLVFWKGKPPNASKTDWLMQEYRLVEEKNPPITSNNANDMREDEQCVPPARVLDEDTAQVNEQPDQSAIPINDCGGSMGGDTVGLCNGSNMGGEPINYPFVPPATSVFVFNEEDMALVNGQSAELIYDGSMCCEPINYPTFESQYQELNQGLTVIFHL
ncbi:hypothetical protein HHK36_011898 [Tetracentron sinense]|uniref:NAC domain-containing protein n=1 Tax=Tetracentron sinense TaxID=13715 RepID=A0A834ZJG5_TETSI|nr:hypothetical protein HHK36_011898 [Tetracentron sinense]